MQRPDLVIFDCDGVLVDSEPATLTVLARNLARHGLELPEAECHDLFVGGTMLSAAEEARRRGAALPEDWVESMYAEMFERLREGVELVPGIIEALDAIDAASIPRAIASNGPEDKMAITLAPSGLLARFEGRVHSAHTHGTAKPEPELLLIAARGFGVAPARTVMVDDSPAGVIAAKRAGMRAIGYDDRGNPERLRRHGADEVISDMRALPGLLGL